MFWGVLAMRGKRFIYRSLDSLGSIERLLEQATEALSERSQTVVRNTPLAELAESAAGIGAGAATVGVILSTTAASGTAGAAALTSGLATAGGLVGGGMVAGIAVVAAPAVILGIAAYAATSHALKSRKMKAQKETLLIACMARQDAIQAKLNEQTAANAERIATLEELLTRLKGVIRELEFDRAQEAA
jgi:hypothetical protein